MSYHLGTSMRRRALGAFSEDAAKAIQDSPEYFAWWYTAKSIGLCLAVATVAYLLGERKGRRDRMEES